MDLPLTDAPAFVHVPSEEYTSLEPFIQYAPSYFMLLPRELRRMVLPPPMQETRCFQRRMAWRKFRMDLTREAMRHHGFTLIGFNHMGKLTHLKKKIYYCGGKCERCIVLPLAVSHYVLFNHALNGKDKSYYNGYLV